MSVLSRLASMDRDELRFRVTCEARKLAARAQWAVARPQWDRSHLTRILAPASKFDSAALADARSQAHAGNWASAHRALALHFARQPSAFPLEARAAGRVAEAIRARFPQAEADSVARAAGVLEGRYAVLGYPDVPFGRPPRWHHDPVHDRTAPGGFWAAVAYLDPAHGDHKVIWELNRHQHWLRLGRAYHLTSDRRYYDEFVLQLEDWLSANPPLSGVNWASMLELAFRSLSWMWALHLFATVVPSARETPPVGQAGSAPEIETWPWAVDLLVGLDRQLTHIEHNLSRYFSPNTHLTGEALALYVSGVTLPELAASGRRMALGREVLLREIGRQIQQDGGHVERSAHYLRYSTDFYLLAALAARGSRDGEAGRFEEAALRQAGCLRTLADDRGQLPLIGDDDGGQLFPICGRPPSDCRDTLASAAAILAVPELAIGDLPEETFWLCSNTLPLEHASSIRTGWPSTALPSSGYYVSRNAQGDHLVFDAGPHGFLNGGHAHSDALSIVLTTAGLPLLVDPGTATYTMDPVVRDLFRSTAMHNTVVMNGRPQSEPAGPFQWRSMAQAEASMWRAAAGVNYMEGRHDGYLPQVHARGVLAVHGFGWFIIDHFLGPGEAVTDAFWHLHPDWTIAASSDRSARLQHVGGRSCHFAASGALRALSGAEGEMLGAFAGVYGHVVPAPCLQCHTAGPVPRSVLTFVACVDGPDSAIAVDLLDLELPPPDGWHAAAYAVRFDGTEAICVAAIERAGTPAAQDAAPGAVWGPRAAKTDGRVAVFIVRDAQPVEGILINGQRLAGAATNLILDAETPLVRVALPLG